MATIDLSFENFEETIRNNDIVIVDFWATWCGPCKMFAPIFEESSEKHSDVVFGKVNTEEHQDLAANFQIRSIPTLMIFREQVIVFSQPGALQASQLEDVITQVKALDMEQIHKDIAEQQAQQG